MSQFIDTSLVISKPYAMASVMFENRGSEESPLYCFRSDISILLYNKSLDQLDEVALKEWLSSMGEKHPKLDFTDDQLLDCIRSRYVQSPQDVQVYLEQIEHQYSLLESKILEHQQQYSDTETNVTGTNVTSE